MSLLPVALWRAVLQEQWCLAARCLTSPSCGARFQHSALCLAFRSFPISMKCLHGFHSQQHLPSERLQLLALMALRLSSDRMGNGWYWGEAVLQFLRAN